VEISFDLTGNENLNLNWFKPLAPVIWLIVKNNVQSWTNLTNPNMTMFVRFFPTQRDMGSNVAYCVDENGIKVPGTDHRGYLDCTRGNNWWYGCNKNILFRWYNKYKVDCKKCYFNLYDHFLLFITDWVHLACPFTLLFMLTSVSVLVSMVWLRSWWNFTFSQKKLKNIGHFIDLLIKA